MICTRCEFWEVTRDDNFCSGCGARTTSFQLRLEPPTLSPLDYPPPVQLIVTNTSRERTIELARIVSGVGWVSLLPTESLPRTVEAGQQATILLDVDPFSAGSAAAAAIDAQLAYGGSASTRLQLKQDAPRAIPNGLPYPAWQAAPDPQAIETPHSTAFRAVDTTAGQSFRVRAYRAQVRPSQALLRKFLDAARSLRNLPLAPEWVWFAYTAGGLAYTVGRDIPGRPLLQLLTPGRLSRTEARTWLRAVLQALHDLHAQAGARGPLYHGALELQHLFVPEDAATPGRVHLNSGLYLEHILTESPYSPEYFIESDLRHAGLAILSLIAGADSSRAAPPAQATMLDEVNDVAVGGTLDLLLRPTAAKPASAQQALAFFDTLVRAERENHRADFQKAYALSGSARLLPVLAKLGVLETTFDQRQAAEAAARHRQLADQAAATPKAAPPSPPFAPVPSSVPPRATATGPSTYALWSSRGRRAIAFGVRWLKILIATALLLVAIGAGILIYRVASWLREPTPTVRPVTPSLSLTVAPNPVQRGQRTTLTWAATGYTRVLLDGTPVGSNGFRLLYPNTSVTYHFQAFTANGAHKNEDLRVTVVGRRTRPKAGSLNGNAEPDQTSRQASR